MYYRENVKDNLCIYNLIARSVVLVSMMQYLAQLVERSSPDERSI